MQIKEFDCITINPSPLIPIAERKEIDYIDTSSVTEGRLEKVQHLMSNFPSRAQREVVANDILISSVRPNLRHYYYVKTTEDGMIASSGFIHLRVNDTDTIDSKFLYYYLTSPFYTRYYTAIADCSQSSYPSFNKDVIEDIVFPNISSERQKRIAKVLSALDDKIALNRKKVEKLEALAKTIYDYWFVQFDFPDANGRPYKSSGGKMVYNPILRREIPDGWEMKRLDDVVTDGGCPVNPIDVNGRPYTPIECFPIRKMSFYESKNSSEAKSSLVCYKAGDILLGAMRVYFHRVCVAPYEGITRTTSVIMRPKCDSVRAFAYETLNADVFIAYANAQSAASQQPFVVWNSIKDYKIVLPGNELVIDYSSVVQPMIDTVIALERENALLSKTREYLLPLLMNGQVEVGE